MNAIKTKPLCILAVDDHHDTVLVFQRLLISCGHRVTTAEGFEDAIAFAQLERFDVLFCDIGMPEHDGYELLAKLRTFYPIRAVAITGFGMPDDVRKIAEAGFDDFLLKPVDFSRLQSCVESLALQIELDRNRDQQAKVSRKFESPWHVP